MNRKKDKCRIEIQNEMTAGCYTFFTMLYAPLIGSDAATPYHTLVSIGTRGQKIRNHILIQTISRLNIEAMEESRHVLEQYLLVETFYDATKNDCLYQVFMPKDGNEFLRHEVLRRLYLKEMGKDVYGLNKPSFVKPCEDKSAYQEITIPFVNILKEDWQNVQEEDFHKLKSRQDLLHHSGIPLSFSYDQFLTGLPQVVFPSSTYNEKNLRTIGELATIHGIDEITMRKLVSQSMGLKTSMLSMEQLKKKVRSCKSELHAEGNKDSYRLPPVHFLQSLQHGAEVSRSDKYLIEALIPDFKVKPKVVNVLIEYMSKMKNQQFPKAYVEKVANTWVCLGIDAGEKALAHIQSKAEEKGSRRKPVQKKELPSWHHSQEEIKVNMEDFDENELLQRMERLRGKQMEKLPFAFTLNREQKKEKEVLVTRLMKNDHVFAWLKRDDYGEDFVWRHNGEFADWTAMIDKCEGYHGLSFCRQPEKRTHVDPYLDGVPMNQIPYCTYYKEQQKQYARRCFYKQMDILENYPLVDATCLSL